MHQLKGPTRANLQQFVLMPSIVILISTTLAVYTEAFHLSFGHRLLRSAKQQQQHQQFSNPQLNPASTLIRPIECRNANNHSEAGICMFSIDCMQNKGTPLSICKHNYFVGTCCQLPDYNNFVGIVYDLRDTETLSSQLEARKSSSSSVVANTTMSGQVSSTTPTTTATSTSNTTTTATTSKPDVANNNNLLTNQLLTSIQQQLELTSQKPAEQQQSTRLDEKYVISSTSLFGSSSSAPASSTVAPIESARNADGKLPEVQLDNQANKQDLVDSFQIQLAPSGNTSATTNELLLQPLQEPGQAIREPIRLPGNSSAYELIKPEDASLVDQTAEVLSSAHSAASGALPKGPSYSTSDEHQVVLSSSASAAVTTASSLPSSSASTSSTTVAGQVNGEQEFSVSTRRDPTTTTSTTTTTTTTAPSPTAGLESSPVSLAASGQPVEQTAWSASSPFVDLVSSVQSSSSSSSSQDLQTTTPFTSSLSTALLPNISSHPYSPTTQPSVVVASSQQSYSPLVSTTTAKQPSSLSTKQQQQQQQTSPQPAPTSESLPTFSQLYNNQHSSSSSPSNQVLDHPLAGQPRPSMMSAGQSPLSLVLASSPTLQAASKIVSASSAASSHATNNLIPGLGGLQSAILSHIPFKLASGLSSGLSNYLQAAMKPAGGSRPLISSNTAPALQYQQGANSTSRPTASVRFPSTTTTATQSPEAAASNISSVSNITQPRDVVKEAQLVCGRPQVMPGASVLVGSNEVTSQQVSAKKRVGRIVGGNQSLFGQWPWMVSLRQWRKGAFLHKCGAALLNENWAITAAHCVEKLGEFDVSKQDEPYPYMERRVKTLVSHPSFDPKTFEYDLALLRFTEPIQFERNILPVCVPHGNDTYVDRMATVIGWGRLYEDGPLPDIIQHVDVPIITNNECEKMYKNAGYIEEIPDMFICAGINKGGRDSCEGDSGGPLTMVDHDGRSYLVGIISWGIGCALPSQPGVYTRITAFSGWINDIITN